MLKLDDNPPILSPGVDSLAMLTGPWWVAHTKPRFEKAFAAELLNRQIGYFLPMVDRVRVWGGRKRHILIPLFPSYVFFCGSGDERYQAVTTGKLCQTIEVVDQAALVRELSAIERTITKNAQLELYSQIPIGSRCRITAGALEGIEGILIARAAKSARMVLKVGILGQGAVMEVDADLIEVLDSGDAGASPGRRGNGQ